MLPLKCVKVRSYETGLYFRDGEFQRLLPPGRHWLFHPLDKMRVDVASDTQRVANVEIDLNRRLVKKEGDVVSLTRTEWMLLQHLAANAGKVMLNTELLSKVWGPEYRDDLQYLRVWVSRLRSKLEPDPSNPTIIKTLQGIGYLLDAEGHFSDAAESS